MIDDELVLRVERLRDALDGFRRDLRRRYATKTTQVSASTVRTSAAQLAERWLVEIGSRDDVRAAIGDGALADLNIAFQRLLTYSERTSPRRKYDETMSAILEDFRAKVIVALKTKRGMPVTEPPRTTPRSPSVPASVFLGQSFADRDQRVNESIRRFLTAYGLTVTTGEKPAAKAVSTKVKARIDAADLFVGVFTRRDKLAGKGWAPSAWVVDEKAYALAKGKRLILLKEEGVNSVGGLQGDYEYIEFRRSELDALLARLLESLRGLREG